MKNKKSLLFLLLSVSIVSVFVLAGIVPTLTALYIGDKSISTLPEALMAFSPDILYLITICFAAYIFIFKKDLRFEWQFFDTVISIYLVFNIVYGFILSDKDILAILSVRITYLPVAFYFLARLFDSQNINQSKKVLHSIFLIYAVIAIIGLILYFVFPQKHEDLILMTGHPVSRYFITRMGSLYLTPVLFATTMTFLAIYFYQKYHANPSSIRLIIYLLPWTCLLLSVSRGPILSYIIAFTIITFIYKKYKGLLKVLIGMSIIVLGVSYYATQGLDLLKWSVISSAKTVTMDTGDNEKEMLIEQEEKNDTVSVIPNTMLESTETGIENNGAATRVNRWQLTFYDFKKQPWGYGLGKTGAVAFTHLRDKKNVKAALHSTDGWYLKMACENGVLGLLSYLSIAGIYLRLLIKKIKKKKDDIFLLALGLFVVINIQNFFSNAIDFHPQIALYWFIIGLSMNTYKENEL